MSEPSATAVRKKTAFVWKKPRAEPDEQNRTQWWAATGPVDRDHNLIRKLFTEVVNQLGRKVIFS